MQKRDVLAFNARLEENLFFLREQLLTGEYRHDPYKHFYVHDPKRRYISAATVKDRIIHQAVTQIIEPLFERKFIFDSYAGRKNKGVHAAINRFEHFLCQASKNYRQKVHVLQCDIKKFYDSVRHDILLNAIAKTVCDKRTMDIVHLIVESYSVDDAGLRGLPLGNVTSQLFTNVYLNEFDHFVKEQLRLRWYVRFCDDFVIVHSEKEILLEVIPRLQKFLSEQRALELHPKKVRIRKISYGVDFLGCVLRPHYRVVRTKTRRRMFYETRRDVHRWQDGIISQENFRQFLQSYFGVLKHGSNFGVCEKLGNEVRGSLSLAKLKRLC